MNTLSFFYLFLRSSNAHTPYDDIVSNYQGEVAEYLASVIFPSTCTELAPSHTYYGRRKKNNPTGFQILCFFQRVWNLLVWRIFESQTHLSQQEVPGNDTSRKGVVLGITKGSCFEICEDEPMFQPFADKRRLDYQVW